MSTRDALLLSALYECLKDLTNTVEEAWPGLAHLPPLVAARAVLARAERETAASCATLQSEPPVV